MPSLLQIRAKLNVRLVIAAWYMDMVIARRPQGTPAGGQFAKKAHPESDISLDEPAAKVSGEISSYAAAQLAVARDHENFARGRVEQFDAKANDAIAKASLLRTKAKTQRALLRWNSTRRAQKLTYAATELQVKKQGAEATAQNFGAKAERMQAGINAEREVVETLAHTDGVNHILCGLNFGPGLGDIDVIAVGNQVVIVEVKAGRGVLEVDDNGAVFHGGKMTPGDPLEQCAKQRDTLLHYGYVNAVSTVCFPGAESGTWFHDDSGCYLVGGTDELSRHVSQAMRESNTGPHNPKRLVKNVQKNLKARQREIRGWIQSSNKQSYSEEEWEKRYRWSQMSSAIDAARHSNRHILKQR
ncbi:MAG: nuclease-related domain-containing protein [Acidimicrobiales bacterium]